MFEYLLIISIIFQIFATETIADGDLAFTASPARRAAVAEYSRHENEFKNMLFDKIAEQYENALQEDCVIEIRQYLDSLSSCLDNELSQLNSTNLLDNSRGVVK